MSKLETCVLCPRLCRPACPVATATGREAAVPGLIAAAVFDWQRKLVDDEVVKDALALCTDCGACTSFCHIKQPLSELLAEARTAAGLLKNPQPVSEVSGSGSFVAVLADQRDWAPALAKILSEPVRSLTTTDALGAYSVGGPGWKNHKVRLKDTFRGLSPVIADGGTKKALEAADISFHWLHELVPELAAESGSCCAPGTPLKLACCGGAWPIVEERPEEARQMGMYLLRDGSELALNDARCSAHLRSCGATVSDAVTRLMERAG